MIFKFLGLSIVAYFLGLAGYFGCLWLVWREGAGVERLAVLYAGAVTFCLVEVPVMLFFFKWRAYAKLDDKSGMPWLLAFVTVFIGILPAGWAMTLPYGSLEWILTVPESVPFLALFMVAGAVFEAGFRGLVNKNDSRKNNKV